MIYVLRSAAFDNTMSGESDSEFITQIKIGYAKDFKNRFSIYTNHNPTIKILYTIDEGTLDDEKNLHRYFKSYRTYFKGNEWYYDTSIITDFFEKYNTISKIREFLSSIDIESEDMSICVSKNIELWAVVNSISDIILGENVYDEEFERSIIFYFDRNKYSTVEEVIPILREYLKIGDSDMDRILDLIEFRIRSYREVFRKEGHYFDECVQHIKAVCSYNPGIDIVYYNFRLACIMRLFDTRTESCKEGLSGLINFTPGVFRYYISNFPMNVIFSTEIEKDISYMSNFGKKNRPTPKTKGIFNRGEELKSLVLDRFQVGDKINLRTIKEELRLIYSEVDYRATPKATDLENYFIIKSGKFKNSHGKWENGFEILSLKENLINE